jgi:hypothetical protein
MKRILIAGVSTGAVLPLTACGNTNHYSHTSATSAAWGMPGVSGMSISRTGGGTPAPLISNTAPSSAQHSAADTMFAAQQQPQPNPGPPVSAPIDGAWALPLPTASYYISTCFACARASFTPATTWRLATERRSTRSAPESSPRPARRRGSGTGRN